MQETKLNQLSPRIICSLGGLDFNSWGYINVVGSTGRIVMMWKSSEVNGTMFHEKNFSVSTEISLLNEVNAEKWLLTNVYEPQDIKSQMDFLHELEQIRSKWIGQGC